MKTVSSILSIFILSITVGFTQSDTVTVPSVYHQQNTNYLKAVEANDFETILDNLYPQIFDFVSREMMLEVFKQTYNNEETKIKLQNSKINITVFRKY